MFSGFVFQWGDGDDTANPAPQKKIEQTPILGKLSQRRSIAGALTFDMNARQTNLSLLFPQVKNPFIVHHCKHLEFVGHSQSQLT